MFVRRQMPIDHEITPLDGIEVRQAVVPEETVKTPNIDRTKELLIGLNELARRPLEPAAALELPKGPVSPRAGIEKFGESVLFTKEQILAAVNGILEGPGFEDGRVKSTCSEYI